VRRARRTALVVGLVIVALFLAWMVLLRISDRSLFNEWFDAIFGVVPDRSILRAAVAVAIAATTVVLLIWAVPRAQVARWKRQGIEGKDLAELGNSARSTVTQALGGLALVATLTLTAYQANETRKSSSQNLRLSEEGQATQLLSHAVDQLGATVNGKASLDTRIGALYSLDRLGEGSPDRTPLVVDILGSYVGVNQTKSNRIRAVTPCSSSDHPPTRRVRFDVLVALKLIGKINESTYGFGAGIGATADVGSADFSGLNLEGIDFDDLDLSSASFRDADLSGVIFHTDSFAGRTDFRGACLQKATFENPDILIDNPVHTAFDFRGADLRGATFFDESGQPESLRVLRKREGAGIALVDAATRQ
jgi:Pentapeptide repeats (8 copies)